MRMLRNEVLFVFSALAERFGEYPISLATRLMFAFVSSPMSLWSFSALLTVATETPQILEMSFNDAIPFSCFMSSSFHPTCFVT